MDTENYPWYGHYDPRTPRHLTYPNVPLAWFLEESARRFPDKAICVFMNSSINYRDLNRLTGILAEQLIQAGLHEGERVAVILPNCPQFVLAFYAIAQAGGVVVAINPTYKEMELSFQLNRLRCTLCDCFRQYL